LANARAIAFLKIYVWWLMHPCQPSLGGVSLLKELNAVQVRWHDKTDATRFSAV
jgi:hypothetical protein